MKIKPRAQEAERTRHVLLATARARFAQGGQAAVAVLEVTAEAGLTTGALYHHFQNRQGLLQAVLEEVAQSVADRAAEAVATKTDGWEQLRAGVDAVLDCCLEPEVRNAYNEAPAIMGLDEWRRLEESKTGVLLVAVLSQLANDGRIKKVSLPLLAAMVKGAIVEGAMSITRAEHPKKVRREAGALLDALLSGLKT